MVVLEQSTVNDQDVPLNKVEKSLEEIQLSLEKLGLTANQSKVYVFLGKYGTKTATEVNRALKLPRTETYQILSALQGKVIVSAMFGHPVKFTVIEITEAIASIIGSEKQKITKMEKQKEELVKLWQIIPVGSNENIIDEKFQMLQGENQINSKINDMTNEMDNEVLIIGSEKDFINFYHVDILKNITKSSNFRILTASTKKTKYMYKDVKQGNIPKTPNDVKDNLCFIVKNNEMLFYMKNKSQKEITAMWANSSAMSYSKKLLFEELWKKSKDSKNVI